MRRSSQLFYMFKIMKRIVFSRFLLETVKKIQLILPVPLKAGLILSKKIFK